MFSSDAVPWFLLRQGRALTLLIPISLHRVIWLSIVFSWLEAFPQASKMWNMRARTNRRRLSSVLVFTGGAVAVLASFPRVGYKRSKFVGASTHYHPAHGFMELPQQVMLAANALIHQHGSSAEEYATRQLWESRQKEDETNAARWLSMLEALKQVRELRAKIEHES
jgi:hypothetical protein